MARPPFTKRSFPPAAIADVQVIPSVDFAIQTDGTEFAPTAIQYEPEADQAIPLPSPPENGLFPPDATELAHVLPSALLAIQTVESELLPTATQYPLVIFHAIPLPEPPVNGLFEAFVHNKPSVDFAIQTDPSEFAPTAIQ